MGLDVFVMPLWKYQAGDFSSPLADAIGREPTRVGTPKPDDPPEEAKAKVEAFQRELSRLSGARVAWSDHGFKELSVQFDGKAYQAIQEFAAFQDQPVGESCLRPKEELIVHRSLIKVRHGAPTRFPHLIFHEANSGYFVPCELPQPVPWPETPEAPPARSRGLLAALQRFWCWIFPPPDPLAEAKKRLVAGGMGAILAKFELEMAERMSKSAESSRKAVEELGLQGTDCLRLDRVGSSVGLLQELEALRPLLGMTKDWGELEKGDRPWTEDEPLVEVKFAWSVLHFAARISVEKKLPIILDG